MARLPIAALMLATAATAGGTHLSVAPRSSLLLKGSSNVASWRCTGRTVNGSMAVAAPIEQINRVIDHIEDGQIAPWMLDPAAMRFPQPSFELTVPIDTLRCTGGRPMENDLRHALKTDQYPEIRFRFVQVRSGIEHDIDENDYHAVIEGQLSLAGTTRAIDFTVAAKRVSRDLFRMRAELPLKMSDFGIAPPTAFFGMLRAADRLYVAFNLFLQP